MNKRALICLLPWFIPLTALARPAKPLRMPAATAPVLVPINSSWIGADGQTYTLTGTLTLSGGVAPSPPPPPPPPATVNLSYLTMSPGTVTAGQSATVNVVLTGAVPLGQTANVLLTPADAGVQAPGLMSIPEGKSNGSAVVLTTRGVLTEKLVAISASYNGKSAYSNLRVQPDGVTPPPVPAVTEGPTVSGYFNGDGSPLTKLIYGQEIRITGQAFGMIPGTVRFNGGLMKILAWSDNDVRALLPLPEIHGGAEFTLTRTDGAYHDVLLPLDLPARMPGSARRR